MPKHLVYSQAEPPGSSSPRQGARTPWFLASPTTRSVTTGIRTRVSGTTALRLEPLGHSHRGLPGIRTRTGQLLGLLPLPFGLEDLGGMRWTHGIPAWRDTGTGNRQS